MVNLLRGRLGLSSKKKRFPKKQTLWKMYSASVNTVTPIDIVIARDYPQFEQQIGEIEKLARAYVSYKKQNNVMDYDDLLVNLLMLLEKILDLLLKIFLKRHLQKLSTVKVSAKPSSTSLKTFFRSR